MDSEIRYRIGYAVIRVDDGPVDHPSRCREIEGQITAGPSNVKVKEILMSAEEARQEVLRLTELNRNKKCFYYWQATHIFINGGSHGSGAPEDEEQDQL